MDLYEGVEENRKSNPSPHIHIGALSKRRLHVRMHVHSIINILINFYRSELCMYERLPRMLLKR